MTLPAALGLGDGLTLGEADGLTETEGDSDGDTLRLADGLTLLDGETDGETLGLTEGETLGDTEALAEGRSMCWLNSIQPAASVVPVSFSAQSAAFSPRR